MKYDHIKNYTSVECRSKAEALGLMVLLQRLGVPVYHRSMVDDNFDVYPNITWNLLQVCRTNATPKEYPQSTWLTPDEFIALFDPVNQPGQLPEVYGHTPVIKDGGKTLKVGCQEIPFETVKTIYKGMKKTQKALSFYKLLVSLDS